MWSLVDGRTTCHARSVRPLTRTPNVAGSTQLRCATARSLVAECPIADEHLVEQRAERIRVGPHIRGVSASSGLFRRHIAGRALDGAAAGGGATTVSLVAT